MNNTDYDPIYDHPDPAISGEPVFPGLSLITEERIHQVDEGYTAQHDDEHDNGELAMAAKTYCDIALCQRSLTVSQTRDLMQVGHFASWPWHSMPPKIDGSRLENLVKAGALIAAEIDRIKRAEERSVKETAESGEPY